MENGVILPLAMLLLITETAWAGVYSLNDITVQPGPVQVKQGQNVSLWCKLKYNTKRVVPVNWQSPPAFKTRTHDCDCYGNSKDKYAMSCSNPNDHFGFYNMTIMDVQWADNGKYRCLYTNHMDIVDLQVLVPVTDVTLEKDVKSYAAEHQRLYEYFTCTTNCAFPAPKISWFINDEPFNGKTTVRELGCSGAKDGQKQTMSRVTMSTDMDKERKEYNVKCTAENVVGEPNVSKSIAVNNDALVGAYPLNVIKVQPGPVQLKQGQNVSLWCKLKYDPKRVVPVNWQSPPAFKTRTSGCHCYENSKDKYAMSCSNPNDQFEYYNMTIMDVQWADNGVYRCLYHNHMDIVDLQVLVPVTDVTLEQIFKSSAAEPQRLHEYFTCTTNCAFPPPKISWLVNDQPFNGNTPVRELGCSGAKEGQKQTMSTAFVMSTDMDKERKEYSITCTAENVVGEPNVSETMAVNNDVPRPVTPSPPLHGVVVGFVVMSALSLTLIVIGVSVKYRRAHKGDLSRAVWSDARSIPRKRGKYNGINYLRVLTVAFEKNIASDVHHEEDYSSREARFQRHLAPPKYQKNDFDNAHNEEHRSIDQMSREVQFATRRDNLDMVTEM